MLVEALLAAALALWLLALLAGWIRLHRILLEVRARVEAQPDAAWARAVAEEQPLSEAHLSATPPPTPHPDADL